MNERYLSASLTIFPCSAVIAAFARWLGTTASEIVPSAAVCCHVIAVVGSQDVEFVRRLGATDVIDYRVADFADDVRSVDVVIDTVGGNTRDRAFGVLKPGGILVTVVSTEFVPGRSDIRSVFFYADVTTARLNAITGLLESRKVIPQVGSVLPLGDVRTAHEMLAGAPHRRGKIRLEVG